MFSSKALFTLFSFVESHKISIVRFWVFGRVVRRWIRRLNEVTKSDDTIILKLIFFCHKIGSFLRERGSSKTSIWKQGRAIFQQYLWKISYYG